MKFKVNFSPIPKFMGQKGSIEAKEILPTKEFSGHTHTITNIFFYKGFLYSGSKDCTVKQWETSSGICTNIYKGHRGYISSLVCNKYGILYSGSSDNEIGVWSAELIRTLKGHEAAISSLLITEEYLYSGSFDSTIRKWDNQTGKCETVFQGHKETITTIKRSDEYLFSSSSDFLIKQWAIDSGKCLNTFTGHTGWVWDILVTPDFIFSASQDKTARKWSRQDAKEIKNYKDVHNDAITRLSLTSFGSILTASWDGTIKEIELSSDKVIKSFDDHTAKIKHLISSGRVMITAADDCDIRIWDLKTGNCLFILKNQKDITCLCVGSSFDIYTGSKDGLIRKFVLPTSKQYESILDAFDLEQSSYTNN